jgi:asparagine synthase (glutamine-hydrolysing)
MTNIIFHHSVDLGCSSLPSGEVAEQREILYRKGGVTATTELTEERPQVVSNGSDALIIFGTPMHRARSLVEISSEDWPRIFSSELEVLDSSFLIFWIRDNGARTTVISDRFGSIGIFWWSSPSKTVFSTEFGNAIQQRRSVMGQSIDYQSVFEMLWFRRLFGESTYIEGINWLTGATMLDIERGRITSEKRYWNPNSELKIATKKEGVERLRASAISSTNLALCSPGRHGLMLSGGLDSRCLLGVGRDRYTSFTNSPKFNNEVAIAESLANLSGSHHTFMPRPADYLDTVFDQAMALSNGMTQYYECQFLGYREFLAKRVENLHLGLFWDIFFCGHYMPKTQRIVFGRNALHFNPVKIDTTDLTRFFVHNIPYRQKSTDLSRVIPQDRYLAFLNRQYDRVEKKMSEGRDLGFSGAPLWEYMHLVDLARHYSMLMARSLRPFLTVHLPALTNENYDIAFSLTAEQKINWSVYIEALNQICPDLMKIKNSNTNIQASRGLRTQTIIKIMKGLQKGITRSQLTVSPSISDRSWPAVVQPFRQKGRVSAEIEQLFGQGRIWDLNILDKRAVFALYEETRSGKENHSIFLSQLLTLEHGVLAYL